MKGVGCSLVTAGRWCSKGRFEGVVGSGWPSRGGGE